MAVPTGARVLEDDGATVVNRARRCQVRVTSRSSIPSECAGLGASPTPNHAVRAARRLKRRRAKLEPRRGMASLAAMRTASPQPSTKSDAVDAAPAEVRAVRVLLPGSVDAADAALLTAGDRRPFALVGRWAGARALVGGEPIDVCDPDADPFALLDSQLRVTGDVSCGFVGGGWVGALPYRLAARVERIDAFPAGDGSAPPFPPALAFYDHLLRCDAGGRWWFEALWSDDRSAALTARLAELRDRVAAGAPEAPALSPTEWLPTPSTAGHANVVAACRTRIAAGDIFQANLSLRLSARLDDEPVHLFTHGVQRIEPDRAAFVAGPAGAIASLSPELFVQRRQRELTCAPIKGTRPRSTDAHQDLAARDSLANSAKDRAENVMIVDLMRNDLGRVCEVGSVQVRALADVRPHAGVWHLVSEVAGTARAGLGDGRILAAMFPPGSVTGAPKLAAINVISELESSPRRAFCGAIGFSSPAAGMEFNVAIRTFECARGRAWLDVGGGIVADSLPAQETAECLGKVAPLLAALNGRLIMPSRPRPGPAPPRLAARPTPRPDPATGIFETLLVIDGKIVDAAPHLERLRSSAVELYGTPVDASVTTEIHRLARAHTGRGRLRIRCAADGSIDLEYGPAPHPPAAATLQPMTVPGGLGAHKWQDRRLLDALERAAAPAAPLLVDTDGLVLETPRANVFAVLDRGLVTPPLDGRILPGTTRARLIRSANARGRDCAERPIHIDELAAARAILTTGALAGVARVGALKSSAILA
ncbi:MAG: chorismate-binding protein [Actinomycetota bacterium]|nr:chorismate-binding protein [Actinomycetota bacterium]